MEASFTLFFINEMLSSLSSFAISRKHELRDKIYELDEKISLVLNKRIFLSFTKSFFVFNKQSHDLETSYFMNLKRWKEVRKINNDDIRYLI